MMLEGMLWFDNNPAKAIEQKVREARERYDLKFGGGADCCMVAPDMLGGELQVDTVKVMVWRGMTPGHLWIGKAVKNVSHV